MSPLQLAGQGPAWGTTIGVEQTLAQWVYAGVQNQLQKCENVGPESDEIRL